MYMYILAVEMNTMKEKNRKSSIYVLNTYNYVHVQAVQGSSTWEKTVMVGPDKPAITGQRLFRATCS